MNAKNKATKVLVSIAVAYTSLPTRFPKTHTFTHYSYKTDKHNQNYIHYIDFVSKRLIAFSFFPPPQRKMDVCGSKGRGCKNQRLITER